MAAKSAAVSGVRLAVSAGTVKADARDDASCSASFGLAAFHAASFFSHAACLASSSLPRASKNARTSGAT